MARSAPTIPIASASGKSGLSINVTDWLKIEKGYGQPLSLVARESILEATTQFVYFEVFERNAEPLSAAMGRVKSIKTAIANLKMALRTKSSDAKVYANHLVKKNFRDRRLITPRGDLFHALSGTLGSLSRACNLALREMDSPNLTSLREGECWDQWARRLTAIAKEEGLPTAASKGSDKEKGDVSSPFVLFFWELQSCVPKAARRHDLSKHALAAAISRARNNRARKDR